MTKQTEQIEQEFIDASLRAESVGTGNAPTIGRIVLEKTELGQQEFDGHIEE